MDQTLQRLADELGLSAMSISRALQGRGGVSEGTRQRVQEAADAAGYRPNLIARALLTGRTDTVGIIARDFSSISNAMLFSALESHLRKEGLQALPAAHADDPQKEERVFTSLLGQRVDALVVIHHEKAMSERFHHALIAARAPTVVVSLKQPISTDSLGASCDCVSYDEADAIGAGARYLLDCGRTKPLLLATSNSELQARSIDDWSAAYRERGAVPDVRLTHFTDDKVTAVDSFVSSLLQKGRPPFDSIVAATDLLAAGAVRACLRARLSVGRRHQDDVSIVCAAGSPGSSLLDQTVTCFCPPYGDIAARCVLRMKDRLRCPAKWQPRDFAFPPVLEERHSG